MNDCASQGSTLRRSENKYLIDENSIGSGCRGETGHDGVSQDTIHEGSRLGLPCPDLPIGAMRSWTNLDGGLEGGSPLKR